MPSAYSTPDQQDIDTLVSLIEQRNHSEAETLARQLTASFPSHDLAWQALGMSLKSQGRIAEAIGAQRQAVALSPGDAGVHYALGESLMAIQQPVTAAESYRRASVIKPDFSDAHFKLGNALVLQNRLSDAVESYRRAVALKPDFGGAHANIGFTLMSTSQFAEAESHLRQALLTHPDSAPIYNALGVVLYGLGRMDEAEASFRRVVSILPNEAEGYSNLGNALREQGSFAAAEANYRRAMALKPDFARAHVDLGGLHYIQENFADAEQSYRHALKIKPDYVEACNNLGRSIKKQGRLEEARECFESALAIDSSYIDAYCNLSSLRTFTLDCIEPGRLERLSTKLPELSETLRVRYWFALGKMREDIGGYDDAFAAYAEGNRLKYAQLPPSEVNKAELIEHVRTVFNETFFVNHPKPVRAGKAPIFIVGMPRSGTTLIEQILSSHPDIHGAGELPDLEDLVFSLARKAGKPVETYPDIAATLSADELLRLGDTYTERVWQSAPEATRITDKMMANFLHVGMIHLMLPNAKIIHAMRDPMDSCFSCYTNLFSKNNLDFTYDLGTVGRYYARYIQLMQHWQRVLPTGTILELRYEDMVTDTEGQARRLLQYLDLPWDPRCLNFHENKRVVKTVSAAQVRRPVYRSSVARWKHFETHLGPLLDIVKEWREPSLPSDT